MGKEDEAHDAYYLSKLTKQTQEIVQGWTKIRIEVL